MKTQMRLILIICISFLGLSKKNFAQVLNLGSMANFVSFTGVGTITNTGASTYSGNIGTNFGDINGFGTNTTVNGTTYKDVPQTVQAKIDLLNVYIHLNNIPITNTTHSAAFGSETITPGVYKIAGVGTLAGSITLDGGNNNNAVFIIKFEGGFSVTAGAAVSLTNGAQSANVFWISEGAIDIGTNTTMKGTLISHPGAISFGDGGSLDGRMLATEGAISFGSGGASIPTILSTIPIECNTVCDNAILGRAGNFSIFSSAGNISNVSSSSGFIGNIGSNAGTVIGFGSSLVIGSLYTAPNTETEEAKADLQTAYDYLVALAPTKSHSAAFGGGEIITPGIYSIPNAGTLSGDLILDGERNLSSLFVLRFGDALTVTSQSKVILTNGARRCNVFWVVEGAIGMGTFTYMKGNVIAHGAANTMGANGNLEGRMFSTAGAVSFSTGVTYITYGLCAEKALPVNLGYFTAICKDKNIQLNWSSVSEINLKNFVLERSLDAINWQMVGTLAAEGSATLQHNYAFTDRNADNNYKYYYRLNQNDFSGFSAYSEIINVNNCRKTNPEDFNIYPNPVKNAFTLLITGDKNNNVSNEIYSAVGKRVYQSNGYQSNFNVSNLCAGIYYVNIHLKNQMITRKIVVIK